VERSTTLARFSKPGDVARDEQHHDGERQDSVKVIEDQQISG